MTSPARTLHIEAAAADRPRARDIGLVVGIFPPGPQNAITDVDGVRVGHATVIEGDDVRTGVTAIIPAPGNLYTEPVPAAIHVGNGYGKLDRGTVTITLRSYGHCPSISVPLSPHGISVQGRL